MGKGFCVLVSWNRVSNGEKNETVESAPIVSGLFPSNSNNKKLTFTWWNVGETAATTATTRSNEMMACGGEIRATFAGSHRGELNSLACRGCGLEIGKQSDFSTGGGGGGCGCGGDCGGGGGWTSLESECLRWTKLGKFLASWLAGWLVRLPSNSRNTRLNETSSIDSERSDGGTGSD